MMRQTLAIIALLLFAGITFGQATKMPVIDPQIIGRWDYLKTSGSDGSKEQLRIIGREHYYADGTVMFVRPYSTVKIPETHEELVAAYDRFYSGQCCKN